MLEKRMLIDVLKYFQNDEFIITHVLGYKILNNNKTDIIALLTNKQLIIYGKLVNEVYINKIEYYDINKVNAWNNQGLISINIELTDTKENFVHSSEYIVSNFIEKLEEIIDYAKIYGSLEFDSIVDNFDYIEANTSNQSTIPVSNRGSINNDPRSNIGVTHNHYHYNQVANNSPYNADIKVPKKKSKTSLIVGIFILFFGVGILGSIGDNSSSSTELTNSGSDKPVVQEQTKNDWQSYAEQYIEIKNVNCSYMNDILDGRIPGLQLEVKNNGDRTISKLILTAYLQDANGNNIYEDDVWIIDAGGFMDDFGVLKPNYSWKTDKNRFRSFNKVPSEWKEGAIKLEVKRIEFE